MIAGRQQQTTFISDSFFRLIDFVLLPLPFTASCVCVCDNVIMSWHWYGETFQTFIFSIIRPWTMTQHTYDNPITRTRIPRRTSVNSLRSINRTRQPTTADIIWHISLQIMYYYLLRPWNVVPDIFQSNEFYCYTAAYIHRVQSSWCSCASSS